MSKQSPEAVEGAKRGHELLWKRDRVARSTDTVGRPWLRDCHFQAALDNPNRPAIAMMPLDRACPDVRRDRLPMSLRPCSPPSKRSPRTFLPRHEIRVRRANQNHDRYGVVLRRAHHRLIGWLPCSATVPPCYVHKRDPTKKSPMCTTFLFETKPSFPPGAVKNAVSPQETKPNEPICTPRKHMLA